jgi:arylsulfatase A-like enzyme
MIDADWQRAAGKGTHATLSRFDMHNTLIATGPDFKRGETNDLASGNVDLTPTILQILGIKPPKQLDGRILSEVMVNSGQGAVSRNGGLQSAAPAPARKSETKTIEATKHFRSGTWRQSLQISRVGSTIYLDEGNGAFVAIEPAANESQPNR